MHNCTMATCNMTDPELLYQIGLTLIPGVGDVLGRKLVSIFGSAEAIFREPRRHLKRVTRVGEIIAQAVGNKEVLIRAEKEVRFIEHYLITPIFCNSKLYPQRLKQCFDSPVMLYYKGTAGLNPGHAIGIVGTRNATEYGKIITQKLVEGLAGLGIMVVSGLAYGIDSCAHRSAVELGLETVGVLGHGLDRIYPFQNMMLAEKMKNHGGLLTEFLSETRPDRENFPKRNRIIAGLCEAIVVVEAAVKGGALITADIANSYNRDVFAIPGRIGDPYSEGTNFLVRTNRAALIQGAEDIEFMMGWRQDESLSPVRQPKLFIDLTPEEEKIVALLNGKGSLSIDEISLLTEISISKTSSSLLNLEFEGKIKCLPGRVYTLL
jgi:DNA processing protein